MVSGGPAHNDFAVNAVNSDPDIGRHLRAYGQRGPKEGATRTTESPTLVFERFLKCTPPH